jgi:hypothetical protein
MLRCFPIKYIKTPKSIQTGSAGNACFKIAENNRVSPRPTKMPTQPLIVMSQSL